MRKKLSFKVVSRITLEEIIQKKIPHGLFQPWICRNGRHPLQGWGAARSGDGRELKAGDATGNQRAPTVTQQ